jgi:hypothetical protein
MNPFPTNLDQIYFRQSWSAGGLLLLLAAALGVCALIYYGEKGLALWKRVLLGGLRLFVFLVILVVLLEPVVSQAQNMTVPSHVLVLIDVSESMAFADDRKNNQDLEDAALALGKMSEVARVPRLDIAKGIVQRPEINVFQKPDPKFKLQYYAFGDKLDAAPTRPAELKTWIGQLQATAPATHLGDALLQARDNFAGQPLSAIFVLSDGASNGGVHPLEAAPSLHVPVFTVPIGTLPENIRLVTATAPQAVFPKDKVPVMLHIESSPGFVGKEAELTIKSEGKLLESKRVLLKKTQFEELSFVLDPTLGEQLAPGQKGRHLKLDIGVTPLPGEANEVDNYTSQTVIIIDEKIKVLYVEGVPRWEFRYLKAILARDPRMSVKFLMTEGDPDLPSASSEYISREQLPVDAKSMFDYDMVILGDVPADFFTEAQLEGMEKLVSKNKGAFLMLAGRNYAPMTYAKTPIANLLPVKIGNGVQAIEPSVFPYPTPAGVESKIMALEDDPEENVLAWSVAKPLYEVPRLGGIKSGATILATLSSQANTTDPYPLIAWQRYGDGKAMYVASSQLWRLRFKRGDEYHARVWSQAIQFLTLARLLGGNKRIYLETDRKQYDTGERVLIQARLLDLEYRPLDAKSYTVLVEQKPARGDPREVVLKPVQGMKDKGIYQGYFIPDREGDFRVFPLKAQEGDYNSPLFHVDPISREKVDQQVRRDLLEKLAELTGGKMLSVRDLYENKLTIPDKSRVVELPPRETELWDSSWVYAVYALILALAAVEWFMRRINDLA